MDTSDQRTCSRCRQTFAPISEHFNRNRAQTSGWSHYCKGCKKSDRLSRPITEAQRLMYNERSRERMRRSRKNAPERDKANKRRWYLEHREEKLAKDAQYRAENTAAVRARARRYHHEHKEAANERRKRHYQANDGAARARKRRRDKKEHVRSVARAYRRKNPNKIRFSDKAKCANRGAAPGKCTTNDVRLQYQRQNGNCHWCLSQVGEDFHVDHVIPLSRGGTKWPDNIVIACPSCNMRKHNMLPEEWRKRLAIEGV